MSKKLDRWESRFRNWMLAAGVTGASAMMLGVFYQSAIGFIAFTAMFIFSIHKMFDID